MAHPLWLASPFLLLLVPCLFLLPPALRAVPWARQPDRHGKPATPPTRRVRDAYEVSTSLTGGADEHSSSIRNRSFSRLIIWTPRSTSICFSWKPFWGDSHVQMIFHLVHSPGRHTQFLRPGQDLMSSFLPDEAVSEKRFIAFFFFFCKFVYTHGVSSSCDVVGGMCTGISFCFLFIRFAVSLCPPRTCSSPPLMPHLIHWSWVSRDLIIRASITLGPSEGASLMHTSKNLHNALTMTISPLLHLHLENWSTHWHLHSVLWIASLALVSMIANAVVFSMATKSVIHWGHGSRRIAKNPLTCRLVDTPNMLA